MILISNAGTYTNFLLNVFDFGTTILLCDDDAKDGDEAGPIVLPEGLAPLLLAACNIYVYIAGEWKAVGILLATSISAAICRSFISPSI